LGFSAQDFGAGIVLHPIDGTLICLIVFDRCGSLSLAEQPCGTEPWTWCKTVVCQLFRLCVRKWLQLYCWAWLYI